QDRRKYRPGRYRATDQHLPPHAGKPACPGSRGLRSPRRGVTESSMIEPQAVHGTTVAALIASGAGALTAAGVAFGHGTSNAHDEATWLVLWRLGIPLDSDLDEAALANQAVDADQQAQVAAL